MGLISLNQKMNKKLTIVNLPKVSLYFSYETLIALVFLWKDKKRLFMNEDYKEHSKITSKHINEVIQLNDLIPIWKKEDQLNLTFETISIP